MTGSRLCINDALPLDAIIEIMVCVPPTSLCSTKLVCQYWRDIQRDDYVRKLQILRWRRSNTSYLLDCSNKPSFGKYCRTIQVNKSPGGPDNFRAVLDHDWFRMLDEYSVIVVCEGIVCLKFRNNNSSHRLMLCNPLTKRMRSIYLPMGLPNRCMITSFFFTCIFYLSNLS